MATPTDGRSFVCRSDRARCIFDEVQATGACDGGERVDRLVNSQVEGALTESRQRDLRRGCEPVRVYRRLFRLSPAVSAGLLSP
jgi:hypothetical protein